MAVLDGLAASTTESAEVPSPLIELIGVRIWAISYEGRRALAPRKLPCGVVVRDPTEEQRAGAPSGHPVRLEIPGRPGLFVDFSGLFLLPTGHLAAVYGAVQERLG